MRTCVCNFERAQLRSTVRNHGEKTFKFFVLATRTEFHQRKRDENWPIGQGRGSSCADQFSVTHFNEPVNFSSVTTGHAGLEGKAINMAKTWGRSQPRPISYKLRGSVKWARDATSKLECISQGISKTLIRFCLDGYQNSIRLGYDSDLMQNDSIAQSVPTNITYHSNTI